MNILNCFAHKNLKKNEKSENLKSCSFRWLQIRNWRSFLSSKNEIKGYLRAEIFALIKKVSFGSLNVSQQI